MVFADDWGRHPSSSQHLFARIAPGNRVLWVETIGLRRPRLTLYDLRRTAEKLRGWAPWHQSPSGNADEASMWAPVPDGLTRYSPPMHPFYGTHVGAAVNDALLARLVRRRLDAMGMKRPLLVTTVPNIAGLVGRLDECNSVYYCVDDFETWPGYEAGAIRRLEAELVSRVGALVVIAQSLIERWSRPGIPMLSLPHGVDVDLFARGGDTPANLEKIPGPRLMSVGLYDERVDVDLLARVLRDHPDWQLVMLGRRTAGPNVLDSIPRVHVLPPVPYPEVPAYLAAADVLLVPYIRNEQTESVSPLKLREFLASGRPVAATPLPEIVRHSGGLVELGDDASEFASAVERALAAPPEMADARRSHVAQESWDARAEAFADFLDPLFD